MQAIAESRTGYPPNPHLKSLPVSKIAGLTSTIPNKITSGLRCRLSSSRSPTCEPLLTTRVGDR